jgi:hypothetical protein
LVGAIANEANIPGKEIGPISIYDEYSVVGVPAEHVDQVLQTMSNSSIRGQAARLRLATARDSAGKTPRTKARSQGGSAPHGKPAVESPKKFTTPKHEKKEKKKHRK